MVQPVVPGEQGRSECLYDMVPQGSHGELKVGCCAVQGCPPCVCRAVGWGGAYPHYGAKG